MQSDVVSSLRPLIIASKLTGFTLFEIDQHKWKALYTIKNIPETIFSIATNLLMQYIFWLSEFDFLFDMQGTKIVRSLICFFKYFFLIFILLISRTSAPRLIYINVLTFTLVKIVYFLKRRATVKMLRIIQDIDDKFLALNLKFNYKHHREKLAWILIGSTCLAFVLTLNGAIVVKAYAIQMTLITAVMQFWSFLATVVITHHLVVGMIGIKHRFELLNLYMKHHPHLLDCYTLKSLAEIHFIICKVIKIYNEVNAVVLSSTIGISFGWFCLFAFGVTTGNLNFFANYFFLGIFDLIMNMLIFSVFWSLVYYAEKVKSQGMLTTKYLYKILHKIEDFRHREVVNSFINQVQNSKIEISCGLFDLNWSLLFKVIFLKLEIFRPPPCHFSFIIFFLFFLYSSSPLVLCILSFYSNLKHHSKRIMKSK